SPWCKTVSSVIPALEVEVVTMTSDGKCIKQLWWFPYSTTEKPSSLLFPKRMYILNPLFYLSPKFDSCVQTMTSQPMAYDYFHAILSAFRPCYRGSKTSSDKNQIDKNIIKIDQVEVGCM
ncbi:hypothetical protein EBS02_11255, partial [bacterium]|nr:hypothetical protein [bacterium]